MRPYPRRGEASAVAWGNGGQEGGQACLKSSARWGMKVINRKTAETEEPEAEKRQIGASYQHAARPLPQAQRKGKRKREIPPAPPIEKRGREKKVTHVLIAQVYRARTHA